MRTLFMVCGPFNCQEVQVLGRAQIIYLAPCLLQSRKNTAVFSAKSIHIPIYFNFLTHPVRKILSLKKEWIKANVRWLSDLLMKEKFWLRKDSLTGVIYQTLDTTRKWDRNASLITLFFCYPLVCWVEVTKCSKYHTSIAHYYLILAKDTIQKWNRFLGDSNVHYVGILYMDVNYLRPRNIRRQGEFAL